MKVKHLFTTIIATSLLFAAGCASNEPQRSAGQAIDDQATARRVEEALRADPAYKFTEVKVVAYEGKVQLSGFVATAAQKSRAGEIAKNVRGVANVDNKITVK